MISLENLRLWVGHTSLPGLLTSATVTVVLTLPRKPLSFYIMLVCDLAMDSYSTQNVWLRKKKTSPSHCILSYIPYQWQIDDNLFNFWHCRKLWLCQPVLLLFLFSYFIFVIQAAYLWVCLVGMGDDHHEAIRYRLTTSDAWNFLQYGILILEFDWKLVTKLYT